MVLRGGACTQFWMLLLQTDTSVCLYDINNCHAAVVWILRAYVA